MEPSLWSKSSWRGSLTMEKACHLVQKQPDLTLQKKTKSTSSSDNNNNNVASIMGTVGVFVVYGSWNNIGKNSNDEDNLLLTRLLEPLLGNHADMKRRDVIYVTGKIQVDANDDELESCVNGNGKNTLPTPPSQLPAVLWMIQRSSMTQPEIRYVTSLKSKDILTSWKSQTLNNNNNNNNNNNDTLTNAKQELKQWLESFGLIPSSVVVFPTPSSLLSSTTTPKNNNNMGQPIRLFVAGDRMSVGKTSVCLGILGNLVRLGYPCESLAYIKPATQSESTQLIQVYCEHMGIACQPIGPIVYYRGFTRAYLAGETEPSDELLAHVEAAVDELAQHKQVVVIDGVGFPAVGSICGTDNASVARASGYPINVSNTTTTTTEEDKETPDGGGSSHGTPTQQQQKHRQRRQPPGVVLVGGSGVGGAVDAYHLNATYFEMAQVPVVGAIFNKLSTKPDDFYSLDKCKEQIKKYFETNPHQLALGRKPFGFVPLHTGIATSDHDQAMKHVHDYIRIFGSHVDIPGLIEAAAKIRPNDTPGEDIGGGGGGVASSSQPVVEEEEEMMDVDVEMQDAVVEETNDNDDRPVKRLKNSSGNKKRSRTREEIEQEAIRLGAAPSA